MTVKGLTDTSLKLILFGGKGGVGKTTCASATGLHLAGAFKTLLLSTDPAHSLADSLGQPLSDLPQAIQGVTGLSALEVSAEKALSKFKNAYGNQMRQILETGTNLDTQDIESVFALPVPGMDEVMGLKTLVDLMTQDDFEKYVVDTAPTGHALRLLASPKLLDQWVKVMATMRWKYRYMIERFNGRYQSDQGDDFLLSMKKTINHIEGLLHDPEQCAFVAVTIPEKMAIVETERLIDHLNQYNIPVRHLIINHVLDSQDCAFCREKRKEQDRYIQDIRTRFKGLETTLVPFCAHEVRGLKALTDFRKHLFD